MQEIEQLDIELSQSEEKKHRLHSMRDGLYVDV
jgi:hypothetical protein